VLSPKLVFEYSKIEVSPSDLMQKKNLTKSDTLLQLALVSSIVALQNKH